MPSSLLSRGEVVLEIEKSSQEINDVILHFSITDTGIGISPEKHQLIFEAFAQEDGSITRNYEGTGLGLAITSRLVALMGGKIWVESVPGKGSIFHFTARYGRQKEPIRKVEPMKNVNMPESGFHLHILLVEDNPVNRKLAVLLLQKRNHSVVAAENGRKALEAIEKEPFDLILMDLQMPEMGGLEATAAIRQKEKNNGSPHPDYRHDGSCHERRPGAMS